MHREFRPEDMHPFETDPFAVVPADGEAHESRRLYVFTAFLGLLIGADLLLNWAGMGVRLPLGLSPVMIAALAGAIYIVYGALEALFQRRIGADFALAQACIAALVLGQPFVAAEVVFIALVGEVLEAVTFARTKRALGRLVDQTPRTARVRRDGIDVEVPARDVAVGDLVIVRAGERIPVDGPVESGRSTVDQSALTGESFAVDKGPADPVFTGTLNQFGVIKVRAEKVGRDTTFGQVVRMVSQARRKKADVERLADRLARYFLPAVEVAAAATLLAGYVLGWPDVWSRAVAVLVVACPCALILATPAAMLASMAWLARHGVLIKGGYALERLAACDTFAFDKTGTLTWGKPEFSTVIAAPGRDDAEILRLAAAAEQASRHPLAVAVGTEATRRGLEVPRAVESTVLPGAGVQATLEGPEGRGARVLVGNRRLLAEHGLSIAESAESWLRSLDDRGETPLIVAVDGEVAGVIGLRDTVRAEAHDAIHDLKHLKIGQVAVLTGDREPAARRVARKVHVKTVKAELLPADKAAWIREQQDSGRKVAMVGDGINDAPALAQADAGIALGGMGSDLAAEAGDLIILGDPLRSLPALVELSRATVNVIRQNIIGFAFGLNAVAVLLASLGILSPVAAALLHQAGSLLVLLNAMRLLAFGGWSELPPFRQLRELAARLDSLDERIDPGPIWRWAASRRGAIAASSAILLAGLYSVSGITAIGTGEVGLVRRFGGYRGLLEPGLHVRLPAPFEQVTRVRPGLVKSMPLGFRSVGSARGELLRWQAGHGRSMEPGGEDEGARDATLLTGDGQFLEVSASLQYSMDTGRPDAIRRFVLGIADPEPALRLISEAVVRSVVGRRPLIGLLSTGRAEAEQSATTELRDRLRALDLGVLIHALTFQDVHPPLAVLDAYRDVSRAESDRLRRENEAGAYRDEKLPLAEAKAQAAVSAAEGARDRQVALASSTSDAFLYQLSAREPATELTDFRLFWEAIADAFAGRPKMILDARADRPQRLIMSRLPMEQAIPAIPGDPVRGKAAGKPPGTDESKRGGGR
jgi:Cu+-exporting ATPase